MLALECVELGGMPEPNEVLGCIPSTLCVEQHSQPGGGCALSAS